MNKNANELFSSILIYLCDYLEHTCKHGSNKCAVIPLPTLGSLSHTTYSSRQVVSILKEPLAFKETVMTTLTATIHTLFKTLIFIMQTA